MNKINKASFMNRNNQNSSIVGPTSFQGNANGYESKVVWYDLNAEQYKFMTQQLDAGRVGKTICQWAYQKGVSKGSNREWNSFAVRYYKLLQGPFGPYGKNFFVCEWWLGNGEATPKDTCPYGNVFGDCGDIWEEFLELFELQDQLQFKRPQEMTEEDNILEIQRLEEINRRTMKQLENLKRRCSKDNSILEESNKKFINNNRKVSILAQTIEKSKIMGTFEDDEHLLDMNGMEIPDDPNCLKDRKLNKKMEKYVEREAKKGSQQEEYEEIEKTKQFMNKKNIGKKTIAVEEDENHYE